MAKYRCTECEELVAPNKLMGWDGEEGWHEAMVTITGSDNMDVSEWPEQCGPVVEVTEIEQLADNQKDLSPEIQKVVSDNFHDLLAPQSDALEGWRDVTSMRDGSDEQQPTVAEVVKAGDALARELDGSRQLINNLRGSHSRWKERAEKAGAEVAVAKGELQELGKTLSTLEAEVKRLRAALNRAKAETAFWRQEAAAFRAMMESR